MTRHRRATSRTPPSNKAKPPPPPPRATRAADAASERVDPNDEVPVPIAMSPAEVDERAQVVEALREEEGIAAPPEQADGQG